MRQFANDLKRGIDVLGVASGPACRTSFSKIVKEMQAQRTLQGDGVLPHGSDGGIWDSSLAILQDRSDVDFLPLDGDLYFL